MLAEYPDSIPPEVYTTLSQAVFLRQVDPAMLTKIAWHIAGYLAGQYFPTGPQAMAPVDPLPPEELKALLEKAPAKPTLQELLALKHAAAAA
jgi:hypothetical protein